VGAGRAINLLELAAAINDALGTKLAPEFAAARPGDVRHSLADLRHARRALGYEVKVEFEDGLRRTIEAIRTAR
jgi:nucleoside-diphosphate-sugar epimerase